MCQILGFGLVLVYSAALYFIYTITGTIPEPELDGPSNSTSGSTASKTDLSRITWNQAMKFMDRYPIFQVLMAATTLSTILSLGFLFFLKLLKRMKLLKEFDMKLSTLSSSNSNSWIARISRLGSKSKSTKGKLGKEKCDTVTDLMNLETDTCTVLESTSTNLKSECVMMREDGSTTEVVKKDEKRQDSDVVICRERLRDLSKFEKERGGVEKWVEVD